MRIMTRREFAKRAGLFTFAVAGSTSMLSSQVIRPKHYTPGSVKKFHDWYCTHFHNFNRTLDKPDLDFIESAFDVMDRKIEFAYRYDDQLIYSNVSYSHKVKGIRVNSSRMAIGSFTTPEVIIPRAKAVIEHRGINVSSVPDFQKTIGLGWDVEQGHLKVYSFHEDLSQSEDKDIKGLVSLFDTSSKEKRFKCGLTSVTYEKQSIIEKKAYVVTKSPMDNIPFAQFVKNKTYMITSDRGVVPQYDLHRNSRLGDYVNDAGKMLLKTYDRQLASSVDTISYSDSDDYTLYYP